MRGKPEGRTEGSRAGSERKSPPADAVLARPKTRRKVDPILLLQAGIALTVAAMSLIVLGVIAGPLFLPGVYVLIAGMLVTAAAGILQAIQGDAENGRA
jgi:hypothetical protein